MVASRIHGKPACLVGTGHWRDLGVVHQHVLGGIGDETPFGSHHKDLIERLAAILGTGISVRAGIGGVHVDDHATKGSVGMTNDLAETKFGCANLCHGKRDTPPALTGMLAVPFIFLTETGLAIRCGWV